TAGATTATVTGGPGTLGVDVVSMAQDCTLITSVGAAKATDVAGNDNAASTSTDNTVTYDTTGPSVTVEQAVGQADPTKTSPINRSEERRVGKEGIVTGAVNLSDTTGATRATVSR